MRCESGISTLTTFILSCLRCGVASCHVWFWILVQLSTTTIHSLFRGRYWALSMSPHFNLLDSSRALKPKWRERTHQMVLWRTSGSCFPNIPNWKSWSSSVIVITLYKLVVGFLWRVAARALVSSLKELLRKFLVLQDIYLGTFIV